MTYPDGPDIINRFKRLENQMEALRRAELVVLEEMVSLYHHREVTEHSLNRLMGQIDALKTLRINKNADHWPR